MTYWIQFQNGETFKIYVKNLAIKYSKQSAILDKSNRGKNL